MPVYKTGGSTGAVAGPSGFSGFFHNAIENLKELEGLPAGIQAIGTAAWRDANRAVGRRGGSFELDDIGKAAYSGFVEDTPLIPLVTGDFGEAASRYYDNPVWGTLDALTVASLGSGAAARAGLTAAKYGGKGAIAGQGARLAGRVPGSLERATKPIYNRNLLDASGAPLVLGQKTVAQNPYIRARQGITDYARSFIPEDAPAPLAYLGPAKTAARAEARSIKNTGSRSISNRRAAFEAASSGLSKRQLSAAFYAAQGFHTVSRLESLRKYREGELARVGAELAQAETKAAKKRLHNDQSSLRDDIKHIERSKAVINDEGVVALREHVREISDENQKMFAERGIRRGSAEATPDMLDQIQRDRMHTPLINAGITPDPGERWAIITHFDRRDKPGKKSGRSDDPLAMSRMAEEYTSDYTNFRLARYERDAGRVLDTFENLMRADMAYERMVYALSLARTYSPDDDAAIRDGILHHVHSKDPESRELFESIAISDRFIEHQLKPEIGGAWGVDEAAKLTETAKRLSDEAVAEGSPGLVMPEAAFKILKADFVQASTIVARLVDKFGKLTKQWRHLVLSLKGSFYVNNFMGNMLLGVIAYGPRYFVDVAAESLPRVARGKKSKRIDAEVSDIKRGAGARNVSQGTGAPGRFDIISRLGEAALRQGVKITEDNFRRAGIRAELRKTTKEVKLLMRADGKKVSTQQAVDMIFNDKDLLEMTARNMYGNLLDYSKLTPFEREILLPLMPFWNFTRSIAGKTINLYMDEPWKAYVLMLIGEEGIDTVEEEVGELPSYLKGVLLGDRVDGENIRAMSTYGMNPFVAPVDLAEQVMSIGSDPAAMGSINPLVSFNPFLKVPAEAITGTDFFYGNELHGSYFDRVKQQAKKNIPVGAYYDKWITPSKRPNLARDGRDSVLAYLGLPVGTMDMANVRANLATRQKFEQRERQNLERKEREAEARRRDPSVIPLVGKYL